MTLVKLFMLHLWSWLRQIRVTLIPYQSYQPSDIGTSLRLQSVRFFLMGKHQQFCCELSSNIISTIIMHSSKATNNPTLHHWQQVIWFGLIYFTYVSAQYWIYKRSVTDLSPNRQTQVQSARSSLVVTHSSSNWGWRALTSENLPLSLSQSPLQVI